MPEPLHPLVVHFPVALAALAPIVTVCAWVAICRGTPSRRAYAFVFATQILLFAAGYGAKLTGGGDQRHVAKIVAETVLDAHEDAADRFLLVTFLAVLFAALGMLGNRFGKSARWLHVVVSLTVCWFGYQAGATGGSLVYEHGAADAFRPGR